jgi:acetyltransferase-like isoleucine patch superfamily enzyme
LVRVQNPDIISVGDGSFIKNYSVIKAKPPNGIKIGKNCSINELCCLSGKISVGNGVRIANQVSIHSFDHEMDPAEMIHEQKLKMGKVTIGDDVWIGTGSRILKDVNIGEGAVVGAGSVVTDDVPQYTVVGGSPAEQISDRN